MDLKRLTVAYQNYLEGINELAKNPPRALGFLDLNFAVSHIVEGKRISQCHITNALPPIEINTQNSKRSISVTASSIEQDNDELLHLIFSKTRG